MLLVPSMLTEVQRREQAQVNFESHRLQQLNQYYPNLVTCDISEDSSFDYSAKCHSPKKEGAKTLRFWLSITRPSLQLAFELRWEYYSLDNEQYVNTHHLS